MTETLEERLVGRYTKKSVKHPETGEVIVGPDVLITEDLAATIVKAGVEEVTIRSVFTCNTRHGVCRHCYGINLATGDAVEVGEAVGTIAAQSIGEPGTQLTMRTFHTGGVASNTDITQGLPRIQEIFEARNPKGEAVITEVKGTVVDIEEDAATRTKKVFVQGKPGTGEYVVRLWAVAGEGIACKSWVDVAVPVVSREREQVLLAQAKEAEVEIVGLSRYWLEGFEGRSDV